MILCPIHQRWRCAKTKNRYNDCNDEGTSIHRIFLRNHEQSGTSGFNAEWRCAKMKVFVRLRATKINSGVKQRNKQDKHSINNTNNNAILASSTKSNTYTRYTTKQHGNKHNRKHTDKKQRGQQRGSTDLHSKKTCTS